MKYHCPVVARCSTLQSYVFVPCARYDYIQRELRPTGNWTYSDSTRRVVPLFNRHFNKILARAGIDYGEFHDLRRTAICNWFAEGLSELEVMHLAGHANFATTHRYYLKVRDDLVHRVRQATARGLCQKLVQIGAASDISDGATDGDAVTSCNDKGLPTPLVEGELNCSRPPRTAPTFVSACGETIND